ncbi:lipopolysaccharide biosynthesis protein [Georgenia subflava]|nr:oligosaccharide flippase family protein [Georgenia subflava]
MPAWQWAQKETTGVLGIALAEDRSLVQLVALTATRAGALGAFAFAHYYFHIEAILSFVLGNLIATGIGLLALYAVNPRYRRVPERSSLQFWRAARPYWVASISAQVRSLDTALIALAASPFQAGLFSLPSRLTGPMRLAATTLSTVALPVASRGDKDELRRLTQTLRLVTIIAAGGLGTLALFAEPIIRLVVGDGYVGSVTPLRILIIGLFLNIPGSFISGVLQGTGAERSIARLGVILALCTIIGVPLAASIGGANGAALCLSLIYVMQLAAVTYLDRKRRQDNA